MVRRHSADSTGRSETQETGVPTSQVERVRDDLQRNGGSTWVTPEYKNGEFGGTHTVTNTRRR
ncbi:hypothetical protein [Actinoallomurus sp. NPDC052274]|uniref:hypothetical protein n=1 Tax=Actinoallomurus sp. NPDC052274 TaxID=3155420 RepID=UPI0034410696